MVLICFFAQLVGLAAWQQMGRNAVNTVCGVKRLLGRTFEHDDVQSVIKSSSVKVISECNSLNGYCAVFCW